MTSILQYTDQWKAMFETAYNIVVKAMYLLFLCISTTGTSTWVFESLSDIFIHVMPASENAYRYI